MTEKPCQCLFLLSMLISNHANSFYCLDLCTIKISPLVLARISVDARAPASCRIAACAHRIFARIPPHRSEMLAAASAHPRGVRAPGPDAHPAALVRVSVEARATASCRMAACAHRAHLAASRNARISLPPVLERDSISSMSSKLDAPQLVVLGPPPFSRALS